MDHLKRLTVGVGAALALFALWMPPVGAQAAGTPSPAAPAGKTISGTYAQFAAELASLPAPTQAQLDAALAYAKVHPMQGSFTLIPAPGPIAPVGVTPNVSTSINWWGIRLHLTQADVHNIWVIVWTTGLAGAGAVLCLPGAWLAVACSIFGAVIGYLVGEIVWNYIGPYVPSCGVNIDIRWNLRWSFSTC